MTELRIWVEGTERVVRGVTDETTCETILLAVAGATRKAGKCALVEKWRDFERVLPLDSRPLRDLKMWGSSSDNTTFEMRIQAESKHMENRVHSALSERSVTKLIELQSEQLDRLASELELLDAFINCYQCKRNLPNNDHAMRVEKVVEKQTCCLHCGSTLQIEFLSQQRAHAAAQKKLRSLRIKIRNADLQLEDLQSVAEKLYSSITLLQFKHKTSTVADNHEPTAEENHLIKEVESVRVEVNKQIDISVAQSTQLRDIELSLNQIDQEIDAKRKYAEEFAFLVKESEHLSVSKEDDLKARDMSDKLLIKHPADSESPRSRGLENESTKDPNHLFETEHRILERLKRTSNDKKDGGRRACKVSNLGSKGIIV